MNASASRRRRIGVWLAGDERLGRRGARSRRLFEVADEGVLERRDAAGLDQLRRRAGREHAARIHQRDPIAALRLVHEMGGDENGHVLLARKIDQRFPEPIPRQGIDARGRLVEDEDLGLVDDGDGERQPLADAQRQIRGSLIEIVRQTEPCDQLGDARLGLVGRQVDRDAREARGSAGPSVRCRARTTATCSRRDSASSCRRLPAASRTAAPRLRSAAAGRSAFSSSSSCRSRSSRESRRSRRARW